MVEQQTVTVDNGYFSVLLGEGVKFSSESNENLSRPSMALMPRIVYWNHSERSGRG